MNEPGYYFMDSPGNDLESIAGQFASGANIIFFITGNGSITNFPFVPTLKFVTTSGRFDMLSDEMDVNAGRYMDGESLEALGGEIFELVLRTASGEASKGERAGPCSGPDLARLAARSTAAGIGSKIRSADKRTTVSD